MMTIHRPGRSVGRSVGHTWRSALLLRSGGMSEVSVWDLAMSPSSVFHVSGLGTPSRPVIAHRGSDRLDSQSRLYAPSDGV